MKATATSFHIACLFIALPYMYTSLRVPHLETMSRVFCIVAQFRVKNLSAKLLLSTFLRFVCFNWDRIAILGDQQVLVAVFWWLSRHATREGSDKWSASCIRCTASAA